MEQNHTTASQQASQVNEVDVRHVLSLLLAHWWWFVIGVVVFLGLGAIYMLRTTPRFTTNASIMLRQKNEDQLMGQLESLSLLNFGGNGLAEDEVVILSSRDLMHQTLEALDLWQSSYVKVGARWIGEFPKRTFAVVPVELTSKAKKAGGYTVTVNLLEDGSYKIKVKQGHFRRSTTKVATLAEPVETCIGTLRIVQNKPIEDEEYTVFRISCSPQLSVVDSYRSKVQISLQKKESNIINLTTASDMPQRDVALLGKLIEQYNLNTVVDKNIIATNTAAFINERLAIITSELSEAEDAVASYKSQNNIADLSEEAKIYLRANSDEQKELAGVETQLNLVEYIDNFLKDDTKRFSLIPANIGISDPSLTSFISEYNTLLLQRMRVQRTATDNNPVVEQLNDQLTSMRQNIIASIASVRESLTITREGLLQRDSQFNARIKSVPTQERQYVQIKRQQQLKEAIYLFLYQKREENALMLASTATPAKIIDAPKVDTSTAKPRLKMVALVCLVLGLAFPSGILYLVCLFDNKISDPEEFKKHVSAPFLGIIMNNSRDVHIAIREGENSVSAEMFRTLRTNINFMLPADRTNGIVLLVTSCINGEGKSYIATNTALSLAILGKKVALVGLDIRKPMLANYFSLTNKGCLTSYLADDSYSLDDAIVPSGEHKNLDILPCGVIPPNPSELLQHERLDLLFAELRKRYEFIIVDTAPCAMVSDTFLLDRVADMTLFVSRANYTPLGMEEFINGAIADNRFKNVACVLNGVHAAKSGYGHYGYYGYGYGTYGYGHSHK